MRYKLENAAPVLITVVTFEGRTISNPTDYFIDEHGLGYPKVETPAPAYDPETHRITSTWQVVDGTITKVWTVEELSEEEKKQRHNAGIDAQIQAVNQAYEAYQTTPLDYTFGDATLKLKPIWTTQYYGTLQQVGTITGGACFPTTITDAEGVTVTMTQAEFQTMYLWLVSQASAEIARVNAVIAELEAQKW